MRGHRGHIVAALAAIACAAAALVPIATAARRSDRQPVVGKPSSVRTAARGSGRCRRSPTGRASQPHPGFQEARGAGQVDALQLTLEEKVGQMTQPEISAITPAEVRQYHIGSVLNGGGSWPGANKHATQADWLALADAYWAASKAGNAAGVPGHLGHRRRARQLERLRRHAVPAQHRAGRRARPVPGPRRRGRHGPCRARHRAGLGLRADAGRGPRRPLGPHLRGLLGGPADHARLRLRGDARPAGRRPRRHRLERRDRHRQALHRRRRHRRAARTRASTRRPRPT